MTTARSFAELLRSVRVDRRMTQSRFALRHALSTRTISAYERGTREPSVASVNKILNQYGLRLVLGTESADADIDRAIEASAGKSLGERLVTLRVDVGQVVQSFAAAEPMIDGALAAFMYGLAVPVRFVDLRIAQRNFDAAADVIERTGPCRWSDHFAEYSPRARPSPREAGRLQWKSWLGEYRIRFDDELPAPMHVSATDPIDGAALRFDVVPLDSIGFVDAAERDLIERIMTRKPPDS